VYSLVQERNENFSAFWVVFKLHFVPTMSSSGRYAQIRHNKQPLQTLFNLKVGKATQCGVHYDLGEIVGDTHIGEPIPLWNCVLVGVVIQLPLFFSAHHPQIANWQE